MTIENQSKSPALVYVQIPSITTCGVYGRGASRQKLYLAPGERAGCERDPDPRCGVAYFGSDVFVAIDELRGQWLVVSLDARKDARPTFAIRDGEDLRQTVAIETSTPVAQSVVAQTELFEQMGATAPHPKP